MRQHCFSTREGLRSVRSAVRSPPLRILSLSPENFESMLGLSYARLQQIRKGVVGEDAPSPPCLVARSSASPNLPKSAPFGGEFLRFFEACGAAPRGGGGAPPTTLILLRNQNETAERPDAARPVPARPASASKICAKMPNFLFFSVVAESCALARGLRGGVSAIRCANVAHVQPPLRSACPCPKAEVLTDGFGWI